MLEFLWWNWMLLRNWAIHRQGFCGRIFSDLSAEDLGRREVWLTPWHHFGHQQIRLWPWALEIQVCGWFPGNCNGRSTLQSPKKGSKAQIHKFTNSKQKTHRLQTLQHHFQIASLYGPLAQLRVSLLLLLHPAFHHHKKDLLSHDPAHLVG